MMTEEMLESGVACGRHECKKCGMERVCKSGAYPCANICREILAERAEREKNPGVWDGAPEWADRVRLEWNASGGRFATTFQTYTRALPKTKAREIAERIADESKQKHFCGLADIIESAINEAMEGEQ